MNLHVNIDPDKNQRNSAMSDLHAPDGQTIAIATILSLWRSRLLIASITAIGTAIVLILQFAIPSRYTSEALLELNFNREAPTTDSTMRQLAPMDPRSLVNGAAKVIGSRKNVVRVIERLGLESTQTGTRRGFSFRKYPLPPQELVANTIFSNLKITHNEKLYVIGVAFTDKDPYAAARIANTLIIEYLRSELLKELTAKHEVAFRELGELSKQFGSRHPNYVQLETRIRYLDSQIDMIRKREPTTENFASPGHHITPAMPILTPTGTSTKLALALGFCISFTLAVLAALLLEMYRSRNNKSPFLPRLR